MLQTKCIGLLSILFFFSSFSDESGPKSIRQITTDTFTFKCILQDIPKGAPKCGVVESLVGYKCRNTSDHRLFILFIACPDLYPDSFFVKGGIYEAEGTREKDTKHYLVINWYAKEKLESLFALKIKRIDARK